MPFLNSAPVLLVLTGAFLGLTLPFGKLAFAAGIAPSLWAFVISTAQGQCCLRPFSSWENVRVSMRI